MLPYFIFFAKGQCLCAQCINAVLIKSPNQSQSEYTINMIFWVILSYTSFLTYVAIVGLSARIARRIDAKSPKLAVLILIHNSNYGDRIVTFPNMLSYLLFLLKGEV